MCHLHYSEAEHVNLLMLSLCEDVICIGDLFVVSWKLILQSYYPDYVGMYLEHAESTMLQSVTHVFSVELQS